MLGEQISALGNEIPCQTENQNWIVDKGEVENKGEEEPAGIQQLSLSGKKNKNALYTKLKK